MQAFVTDKQSTYIYRKNKKKNDVEIFSRIGLDIYRLPADKKFK